MKKLRLGVFTLLLASALFLPMRVATAQLKATLEGHTEVVWSVAFSPDGQMLASASWDQTVRLWDVETEQLLHTLTDHTNDVMSVAFSPDGKTLASSDWDGTICLWNPHTGQLIRTITDHRGGVSSVVFSPDGTMLASGSASQTIRLWNTTTWQVERTLTGHTSVVDAVAFSPDGAILASGSRDTTIRLWNPHTGHSTKTLEGHTNEVLRIAFSPDGSLLASGSRDETVRLWNPYTGQLKRTLPGQIDWVNTVAFSPDGGTLAIGNDGVSLWDTDTEQYKIPLIEDIGSVVSVVFSPDGQMIASGSADNLVRLLESTPPEVPFATIPFDINNIPEPVPPPEEVRDFFHLTPFYQQWINVEGFPVLASAKVSPYAVKEIAWQIGQMIGHRSDILKAMAAFRLRFTLIAHNELTSDVPELRPYIVPHFYTNVRSRGGACWYYCRTIFAPEEQISAGSVTIHEMAHGIHEIVNLRIDPTFDSRLEAAYNAAMDKGLWQGSFFAINKYEYWAEGVGVWFHDNNSNPIKTRDALKAYDPSLALLIAEIFGDGDWLYTPIQMRTHLPHLHGFNPQDAPRIEWPPGVVEAYEELRNPAIEERNEWVNLPPYDPSLIPSLNELRNGGGDDDSTVVWTDILVANTIDAEVLLYWVNPDGTETLEYRFPPNPWMIAQFGCRVGDLLLAKDSSGTPLAVFQAVEKVGRAFVGPSLNLITPGLSKNAGDNQSGVSGAVLPSPFVVEVRDENGSALEGISITFAVVAGDGTLSITHTTTDENGRAESSFILGSNLGTNTVSVSAAGIEQTVTFNAVAVAAVDIPDPNLRTAIENALGKGAGEPIIPAEMLALTHLEADNANISDLTGLEHATLLKSLELEGEPDAAGRWHNSNSVSDLSPLAGLTRLEVLELWGNSVSDISPLTGLTNLKNLGLVGNNISDISALVANTGLGTGDAVWLSGNPLNYQSFYTYIPALQSRGVDVQFDAGVTRPPDVNSDGRVDILDLVVIASKFGNQGQNLAADASGDGVIDVLDLMLVAGMFEGAAAAPSAQRQAPETLTAVEVQGWLTDARTLQVRDPIMKRGFAMLEQLLVFLTPRETELLSNYPNPFNPETWIPYRLAEDANVTLTIYDSSGQVIRTLDVGHRIASAYENRSKAIYWDGKNGLGEQVASGIYFYTLTAGDFSVTRRLVILK